MTTVYRITSRDYAKSYRLPLTTRLHLSLEAAQQAAEAMAPTERAKRGWTLEWTTRGHAHDRWYLEQRNSRGRLIFVAIVAKTVA